MARKRTKICPRCKKRERASANKSYCKICRAEYSREWYRKKVGGTVVEQFDWQGLGLGAVYGATKHTCARKRDLEWAISKEMFVELSQKNCHWCGCPPANINSKGKSYNGLDRIDNSKGYTEDNVVVACGTCNVMRGEQTTEEFLNKINDIYRNHLI